MKGIIPVWWERIILFNFRLRQEQREDYPVDFRFHRILTLPLFLMFQLIFRFLKKAGTFLINYSRYIIKMLLKIKPRLQIKPFVLLMIALLWLQANWIVSKKI